MVIELRDERRHIAHLSVEKGQKMGGHILKSLHCCCFLIKIIKTIRKVALWTTLLSGRNLAESMVSGFLKKEKKPL